MSDINTPKLNFRLEVPKLKSALDTTGKKNMRGKMKYTAQVAKAQERVKRLDRYDDFRELKIPAEKYERPKGSKSKYGIGRIEAHEGGEVIFPWQKTAALRFLRELRGFGLLADVVGSGKTFEAAVVLSELAYRNKMKSLLIVAPEQVYNSWIDVLEYKFGMGEGVLYQVRKEKDKRPPALNEVLQDVGTVRDGDYVRPARPIIVDTDVFVDWKLGNNNSLLFDAVVVDEAHHFSDEKGRYANALVLLSQLMQVKKAAGVTYCLLLSATPHSGNLTDMFRLWYFIRCTGGKPSDFAPDGVRTKEYLEEQQFYKNNICHGASSVPEFVRIVRRELLLGKYSDSLEEYLSSKGIKMEQFKKMPDYEQTKHIDEMLRSKYKSLVPDINKEIAAKYHFEVLRSIMIRQENKLPKKKNVCNLFFYPMSEPEKKVEIVGFAEDKITVDFSSLDKNYNPSITGKHGKMALEEYIEENAGNRFRDQSYGEILNKVMGRLKEISGYGNTKIFTKQGYNEYYSERFREMVQLETQSASIIPVKYTEDKLGYKFEYARDIMRKHKKERILVFFDYELPRSECVYDEFEQALKADKEFADRILVYDSKSGSEDAKAKAEHDFKAKDDAILIVKHASLTEGANLQDCNIMINFQVSPDPVAMDQRIGRIFRLGQKNDVTVYCLADMNKLEGFALAYFGGIGLLATNSGDATILAGSNCDQMVAVRCPVCKRVELMPKQEYRDLLKAYEEGRDGGKKLLCGEKAECRDNSKDGKGTLMTEISVYDFECDTCHTVMSRAVTGEGYECVSYSASGVKGKMCNTGDRGDRQIYCRKICAISNCNRFMQNDKLRKGCKALKLYKEKPTVGDHELIACCASCKIEECLPKCKLTDDDGKAQIGWDQSGKYYVSDSCHNCRESGCRPKPHVLDFDEEWQSPCPACEEKGRDGTLRPVVAKTFATFIREAWKFEFDGGKSFCEILGREADNVKNIRNILTMDKENR